MRPLLNAWLTATGLRVSLRPLGEDDDAFARRVFAATRGDGFRHAGLPAVDLENLIELQRRAQLSQYHARFPDADVDVVIADGEPVGYWQIHRGVDRFTLIDVALLPEASGQGIGSCLVGEFLNEAAAAGKPVSCHVERHNPAARLWRRLGFRVVNDDGVYLELEADPAGPD